MTGPTDPGPAPRPEDDESNPRKTDRGEDTSPGLLNGGDWANYEPISVIDQLLPSWKPEPDPPTRGAPRPASVPTPQRANKIQRYSSISATADVIARAQVRAQYTRPDGTLDIDAYLGGRTLDLIDPSPPPDLVLGRLAPDGPTCLFGMGDVGKGLLCAHYLCELVKLGHRPMILDYEGHPREWSSRVQGLGGDRSQIKYHRPASIKWKGHIGPLWEQTEDIHDAIVDWGATFLIIDSLSFACHGFDLKDETTATSFYIGLERLELPSLTIAHTRREGRTDQPFGSVMWHNGARITWSMERSGHDLLLKHHKKNEYDQIPTHVVSTTFYNGVLREVSERPYAAVLPRRLETILEGGPLTVTQITTALNDGVEKSEQVQPATVRTTLNRGLEGPMPRFAAEGPASRRLWRRTDWIEPGEIDGAPLDQQLHTDLNDQ